MPTRNINLTDYYDSFVQEQIASGRFKNASEVMRAGLRLLESQTAEEHEKLQLLRGLAAEGFDEIDQGLGIAIRSETQLRGRIAALGKRAAKHATRKSD
jgi:antitoxin ParD1/3/4